jgi:hypothetical protein
MAFKILGYCHTMYLRVHTMTIVSYLCNGIKQTPSSSLLDVCKLLSQLSLVHDHVNPLPILAAMRAITEDNCLT